MAKVPDPLTSADKGWAPMLRARPVRNHAVSREAGVLPQGLVLRIPRHRPKWLVPPLSWLLRVRATTRLNLDALGEQIWNLCDGQHTVEAMIEGFAKDHELTFHEARVAVTPYLRALIQRGAVAIALTESPP